SLLPPGPLDTPALHRLTGNSPDHPAGHHARPTFSPALPPAEVSPAGTSSAKRPRINSALRPPRLPPSTTMPAGPARRCLGRRGGTARRRYSAGERPRVQRGRRGRRGSAGHPRPAWARAGGLRGFRQPGAPDTQPDQDGPAQGDPERPAEEVIEVPG